MNCTYAQAGTYGHECGAVATLVGERKSDLTKNGRYFARRCECCARIKGGENAGIKAFIPFRADEHVNIWK